MASNQKTARTPQSKARKVLRIAIRFVVVIFIVALLLYCIKLNYEIKLLEQVCDENELIYKALYEEYIEVHEEKNYFERAYYELYEFIYSED